jgi:hypothetical protein
MARKMGSGLGKRKAFHAKIPPHFSFVRFHVPYEGHPSSIFHDFTYELGGLGMAMGVEWCS